MQDEVRTLLASHVPYLTPSTLWYLKEETFKTAKSQQHTRLKVTFVVHDRFEGDLSKLINLAATIKSPIELVDVFLKAVIRTGSPFSYQTLMARHYSNFQHI